ncbi:MAG: DUF2029 domain-containing protein [Paracoccaceae bacterium]|nr:DUF2029 domain-containing protein [Paracoccaceae bacterium]
MGGPVTQRLLESGVVRIGITLFLVLVFIQSIAHFFGFVASMRDGLLDFDAFYVAGKMFWEGNLADAYSARAMFEAQRQFSGSDGFMPWTYPPQFDLVVAGLALLPRGVAYLLFGGLSLMAYLWVMRRLAGAYFYPVLLMIAPALQINMKSGQNGFLTGALVGAFCLLMLRRRASAGLPLGLMVIKPHLALGLGVSVLAARRWGVVAWSAAVVILTSALATLVFGVEIWAAFLNGAAEASAFLEQGEYQLHRMTSLFAALETLGVPTEVALPIHGALAVAACAGVAYAAVRLSDPRRAIAVALFGTLLVSPYNYDYDLTLLGVALALIAPDFLARARDRDVLLLLLMAWVACGSGLAVVATTGRERLLTGVQGDIEAVALGFYGYVGLLVVLVSVLAREPWREAARPTSP